MPAASERFRPIDFKTRFRALDGIRALAVTMVFADHYGGGRSRDTSFHLSANLSSEKPTQAAYG